MSILDTPVSLFRGAYDNGAPFESPLLSQVLTRIQQGVWRADIARVRRTLAAQGEDAYRRDKNTLVALTPACAIRTRKKKVALPDRVVSVTNIVHYDPDKLDDHAHVKALLSQNPHVAFVFTSPRGTGLKLGIAARGITTENYKRAWPGIRRHLQQRYRGGEFVEDDKIQYINALCFVSDDPDLYLRREN